MKRICSLGFFAFLILSLAACKKGSVSGQVLDPFTGKPVQNATVWIKGTPFLTKTPDGSFRFEKVKPGSYTLNAGKNKYSESVEPIVISDSALDITKNIYIFSKEDIEPGMYKAIQSDKPEKISNLWLNWEANCKESLFAYRLSFLDSKTKKNLALPEPTKIGPNFKALYYQANSASVSLTAKAFPVAVGKIADHPDCSGFNPKDKEALFPLKDKAIDLQEAYKSDNLFEFSGDLPKGKQVVAIMQGAKILKTYYFSVE